MSGLELIAKLRGSVGSVTTLEEFLLNSFYKGNLEKHPIDGEPVEVELIKRDDRDDEESEFYVIISHKGKTYKIIGTNSSYGEDSLDWFSIHEVQLKEVTVLEYQSV